MTVTAPASTWAAYMTVGEAAAVMRVSKMTVYRLIHRGHLPATRAGRSFRIAEADLSGYLAVHPEPGEEDA